MKKISTVEFADPHARLRQEQETVIATEKAAYGQESAAFIKEHEKIVRDWKRLSASWNGKQIDEQTFIKRGRALEERVKANDSRKELVMKRQDSIIAAMNKQIASYDDQIGDQLTKMRALTSLLRGTGRQTAATEFLHTSLVGYSKSADRGEKNRLLGTIHQIFDSAVEFNPTDQVPSVLSDFERITDAEQRSAFYKANREALHSAFNAVAQVEAINENSSNP